MSLILPIARGEVLVDDEDYEWLSAIRWQLLETKKAGSVRHYASAVIRCGPGKRYGLYMHRAIVGRYWPLHRSQEVDHVNGDGLDNRHENLRQATRQQNHVNSRAHLTVRGEPRVEIWKGVTLDRRSGRWLAQIKSRRIGTFSTPGEAARAYDAAAREAFGEFACVNFPGEDDKRCALDQPATDLRPRGAELGKARGERHGNAKLTEEKVRHIRASDWSTSELARFHGVSEASISLVRTRAIWRHVA